MTKQNKPAQVDYAIALDRIRDQWEPPQHAIDKVAKAAAMSNNTVLDLTAEANAPRRKLLVEKLKARGKSKIKIWARLAMQLAMAVTGGQDVKKWVHASEWGLDQADYAELHDEATEKIRSAPGQLYPALREQSARISVVQLMYFSDFTTSQRQRLSDDKSNSILFQFAKTALNSVKPGLSLTIHELTDLAEVVPDPQASLSRTIKTGVYEIVARELDIFEHIPMPGFRHNLSCIGPDVDVTRKAASRRTIFTKAGGNLRYHALEFSAPEYYLRAYHPSYYLGEKQALKCEYDPNEIAKEYARLLEKPGDSGASGVPMLLIDQAMADAVVDVIDSKFADAKKKWKFNKFIDLLRPFSVGPSFPVCLQLLARDKELVRLVRRAVIDEQLSPGELFTVGALASARFYAKSITWVMSECRYTYEHLNIESNADSLLDRVKHYAAGLFTDERSGKQATPPSLPSFCKLHDFQANLNVLKPFILLLADELLCRLIPEDHLERLAKSVLQKRDLDSAILLLKLVLPSDWVAVVEESKASIVRVLKHPLVLPSPSDNWRDGPAG